MSFPEPCRGEAAPSVGGAPCGLSITPVSFLCCRLGMNPFQKNPKHASVLAERYFVFRTRGFLLETAGFQCSLKRSRVTGRSYESRVPPSAAGSGAAGPAWRRAFLFTRVGFLPAARRTQTGREGLLLPSPCPPLAWQVCCRPFLRNLPGLGASVHSVISQGGGPGAGRGTSSAGESGTWGAVPASLRESHFSRESVGDAGQMNPVAPVTPAFAVARV